MDAYLPILQRQGIHQVKATHVPAGGGGPSNCRIAQLSAARWCELAHVAVQDLLADTVDTAAPHQAADGVIPAGSDHLM